MMLSYPGENRTFRHSSKNSSTRKARKVYYVHQVIFNVHVQCIYETEFFFILVAALEGILKNKRKRKTVLWQRWFVWMRTPKKRKKRIVYNTCTYVLRLAFIKEKKIENGDYMKVHIQVHIHVHVITIGICVVCC